MTTKQAPSSDHGGIEESGRFFSWLDATFLPNVKKAQRANPMIYLEELIQARVCVIFSITLGVMLLFATLSLYREHGSLEKIYVYVLWVILCLGVGPVTIRRAQNVRTHALILGTVMNASAWIGAVKGATMFRLSCTYLIAGPVCTMFIVGNKAGVLAAFNSFGIAVMKLMQERRGMKFVEYDKDTLDVMFLAGGVLSLVMVALLAVCNNYIREERLRVLQRLIRQLEVAVKEAEDASETKTRFLANMSHEIRTPLNGIIGMTEILAQSKLSSGQRKELHIISQCGQGLLNIVTDILDFSKIIANKVEIEHVQFSVDDVIARCFDTMAMRAHYKSLQLSHDLSSLPQRVMWIGDPTRLQQIVLNLLSNAVKFTPEFGEVSLLASIDRVSSDNWMSNRLYVEVADSGPGVPETQLARIFDPFSQGDVSTTRTHGGTGLGLAITRSLVELLGGTISVRSSPQGAVFGFDVLLDAVGEHVPRPVRPATGTVLLVDTFLKQMTTLSSMLEKLGVPRVLTATVEQAPGVLRDNRDIQLVIINVATYQPEQDRWREEFLIKTLLTEVDVWDFQSNRVPRIILLRNVLPTPLPLLDAFLARRDASRRIRVAQIDHDTDARAWQSPSRELMARNDSRGNAGGGVSGGAGLSAASSTGLLSTQPSGGSVPEQSHSGAEDMVTEIVFLVKPVQFRQLHMAMVANLDSLPAVRSSDSERDSHSQQSSLADMMSFRVAAAEEPLLGTLSYAEGSALESTAISSGNEITTPRHASGGSGGMVLSGVMRPQISEQSAASSDNQSPRGVVNSPRSVGSTGASGGGIGGGSYSGMGTSSSGVGLLAQREGRGVGSASMTILEASGTSIDASLSGGSGVSVFSPTDARPLPRLRVLVVDDNAINVMVAVRLLRSIGHESASVNTGAEAVAAFRAHLDALSKASDPASVEQRAFICLLDLHMPGGMDGMEVARQMRALTREQADPPPLYIVAVTADALESTRMACLNAGFNDFLTKPFHLARLKQVTRQAAEFAFSGPAEGSVTQ